MDQCGALDFLSSLERTDVPISCIWCWCMAGDAAMSWWWLSAAGGCCPQDQRQDRHGTSRKGMAQYYSYPGLVRNLQVTIRSFRDPPHRTDQED